MRNTEMGTKGRRYDRQRWELMAAVRFTELGIDGRRYDIQNSEPMTGVPIYSNWYIWHAIR